MVLNVFLYLKIVFLYMWSELGSIINSILVFVTTILGTRLSRVNLPMMGEVLDVSTARSIFKRF